MASLTQEGIQALKTGDKSKAVQLLRLATQQNPQEIQAWMWLSGAVDTDQERLDCLLKVLEIDPDNTLAAKGIAKLVAAGKMQVQAPEPDPIHEKMVNPSQISHQEKRQPEKEQLIFEVKPSLVPFIVAAFLFLILLIALIWLITTLINSETVQIIYSLLVVLVIGVGYLRVGWAFVKALFASYRLTTQHLILQTGIFSRSRKAIPIKRIQDVTYHQHLLFRPFGVGDVIVESAGERGQIRLQFLSDCQNRSHQILQIVQQAKE